MIARLAVLVLFLSLSAAQAAEPVRVIFDTDMDSDCDDVGALANAARPGRPRRGGDPGDGGLLAEPWSPACVDAINTFYGRPDLPIGRPKKGGRHEAVEVRQGDRRAVPAGPGPGRDTVPDAMTVYRKV